MTEVKFKPINSNLLILIPEVSRETKAGIVKSESQIKVEEKKMDRYVTVVAIADEVTNIKAGDKILLGINNVATIIIDEIKYGIVHINGVTGIKLD